MPRLVLSFAAIAALASAVQAAERPNILFIMADDHAQRAMRTRAIENGVFVATCNRWGVERRDVGRLAFTGRSQIVDPRGTPLATLPAHTDRLEIIDIDPTRARDKALTPRNHLLKDRRPDLYGLR